MDGCSGDVKMLSGMEKKRRFGLTWALNMLGNNDLDVMQFSKLSNIVTGNTQTEVSAVQILNSS